MSIALACSRCGRPMHSTGVRGMCPRCLFACTARLAEAESPEAADEEEKVLGFGQAVGPGGRFLLLDKLGEGGMGEVWLATDQALSEAGEPQLVALKFLSRAMRQDAKALALLRAEVLRSQRLSHPNIVRIFDLHTHESMPFIKMEYVEGNSLRRWLDLAPEGVMPWRMVAQLAQQLVSALEYAHLREGIVHRDLKPSNLLLSEGPTIKLTDFGIAVGLREGGARAWEGGALGTLPYASPQQLCNQKPAPEDDIYALGATLYELLTGSVPFEAGSQEELVHKVLHEPPQPIPERLVAVGRRNDVPTRMLILVQRCLEKDPLSRPKTHEIARLLQPVLGTERQPFPVLTVASPEVEWAEPARPAPKRRAWLLFVFLAMLGVGSWVQDWGGLRTLVLKRLSAPPPPRQLATYFDLRVTSDPEGAEVEWSPRVAKDLAKIKETAPFNLPFRPGEINFTARKAGYAVLQTNFVFSPDQGANVVCLFLKEEPPPLQPLSYGDLAASVRGALVRPFYWIVSGQQGQQVQQGPQQEMKCRLVCGQYTLTVRDSRDPPWVLKARPFAVEKDRTTNIQLAFAYDDLSVTSEPSEVKVEWPPEAVSPQQPTSKLTPFSQTFKAGEIALAASKRGYFDLRTNYIFNSLPKAGKTTGVHVVLRRTKAPLYEDWWTNSLKMVFRRVDSFWACITETRVGDFRQFVQAKAYHEPTNGMLSVTARGWEKGHGFAWDNPGFPQTDEHPVVGVSWIDATNFCGWLTELEHRSGRLGDDQKYRLPKTTEWARLAGGHRFPWGDDPAALSGNYSGTEVTNSDWPASWPVLSNHRDDFPRTAPVYLEIFRSPFGFYHLGGNAAEWCEEQVLCGGSWFDGEWSDKDQDNLQFLSIANAQPMAPEARYAGNGFRVIIYDDTLRASRQE